MDEPNKKETYSLVIEVNGEEKIQYLEPSDGDDKLRRRIYISESKTAEDILKEVDSLCTKYYESDNLDVFKDFNKIYHALKNMQNKEQKGEINYEKIMRSLKGLSKEDLKERISLLEEDISNYDEFGVDASDYSRVVAVFEKLKSIYKDKLEYLEENK